jgi:hypothetical protein
MTIDEAFRDEAKGSLFNLEKINDQIAHNNSVEIEDELVRGNFEWKDGIKDTEVLWKPNPKGRFLLAWIPDKSLQNRWVSKPNIFGGYSKHPLNDDLGCLGADSYDVDSVIDSKLVNTDSGSEWDLGSKGAIVGFLGFNMGDIPSKYPFLLYCARPQSAEIFFEDVLMCCIFYGMPILIENNKPRLLYHFLNRGYSGFSLRRFDKPSNRLSSTEKMLGGVPGTSPDVNQMHWTSIESHVNSYVGYYEQGDDPYPIREENVIGSFPFNKMLQDWAQFNIKDRTQFDISMASGYALMGLNRNSYKMEVQKPTALGFKVRTY